MNSAIVTVQNKKDEKFLKTKTADFDFKKFKKKEINDLLITMKKTMRAAKGIGLSANQIGLNLKLFVAEVPNAQGEMKFYAVFNPRIEKSSREKLFLEEGCLSVPGTYGMVERFERVVLGGFDKNGKPFKIKAWGLLAHVFQHEVDHLNGIIFTSRARELHEAPTTKTTGDPPEARLAKGGKKQAAN
ncbi:MAG: peptide deformylase [Patescibacteria group bacterium]|mgnify:CR=1 FL=1